MIFITSNGSTYQRGKSRYLKCNYVGIYVNNFFIASVSAEPETTLFFN